MTATVAGLSQLAPEIRQRIGDRQVIVSMSGGKDSVATWLWARRVGLNPLAWYVDTRWEWDGHHPHLDLLESKIGPVRRLHPEKGFAERVREKGIFPSRVIKWCTEELKIAVFARELEAFWQNIGIEPLVLLGIRREESKKRGDPRLTPEWEYAPHYGCEVWRPILGWTLADVMAEHHRAGVPVHPLYRLGAERVGCWPCVNAPKAEIDLVARLSPERIDEIAALEQEIGHTMFARDRRTEKKRLGDDGPSVVPIGIREVVGWSATDRGGAQLRLLPPVTGCMRWGICDPPPEAA